jgi:Molybdenum Cofactor Synthesis C
MERSPPMRSRYRVCSDRRGDPATISTLSSLLLRGRASVAAKCMNPPALDDWQSSCDPRDGARVLQERQFGQTALLLVDAGAGGASPYSFEPPEGPLDDLGAGAPAVIGGDEMRADPQRVKEQAADLDAMARHFRGSCHIVRFIEYMDVGHSNGWRMDEVLPAAESVAMIGAEMPLEPVAPIYPGEVVERWRYGDGSGEIGVIASVTRPFCGGCTRARLSAEGKLFTCLFAVAGHDLRALLRGGASDAEISAAIGGIWWMREDSYSELRTAATAGLHKVEMSYIGG